MLCESEREGEREVVGMPLFCEERGNGGDWRFWLLHCSLHTFPTSDGGKRIYNVYILPSIVSPCLLNISFENISMTCILTDPLVS